MRRRLAWSPPVKSPRNVQAAEPVPAAGQGSLPRISASHVSPSAQAGSAPAQVRTPRRFQSPEALGSALREAAYVAGEGLSTAAFLAISLGKPLLLEGAPGVGKTEAGKALAEVLGRDLIRLQCYEGMDSSAALYEWNYPAQMLALRRAGERDVDLYDEAFLIERPILAALRAPARTVLPHRRDRSIRSRIRGVPARVPVRFPDIDSGDRNAPSRGAARRRSHLQPYP